MLRLVTVAVLTGGLGLALLALGPDSSTQRLPLATSSVASAADDAPVDSKPDEAANPGAKKQGAGNKGGGKQGAKKQGGKGNQQGGAMGANQPPSVPPASAEDAKVPVLSTGDSYDDFASIAAASDGTYYAAYAAYYDGYDQIRLHRRRSDNTWSTGTHVPLVQARADIWMPQVAVDAHDRPWVIWSEQTGQTATSTGNWDLYARELRANEWGPIVRLTENPKPDINHHVAVDAKHNIYVVWQAHPENNGDIMLRRFDGKEWSKPIAVTSGSAGDWYPQVAIDSRGVAWIAFDSYRNGDYDVYLTSLEGETVGELIPIATSRYYEAHPSVTCTPDGKVWIAWEQAGYNWGKDQGYWLKRAENAGKPGSAKAADPHPAGAGDGSTLGSPRRVQVVAYQNGTISAAPEIVTGVAPDAQNPTALPNLATGSDGRVWLSFRRMNRGVRMKAKNQFSRFWSQNVSYLTADGWKPASTLPGSTGRISVFNRIIPTSDGGLAVAYSGDQRGPANYHQPIRDQVLATLLPRPEEGPGAPMLEAYQPPEAPPRVKPWDVDREEAQVAAIRKHRTTIEGKEHRIVRGDLHRHTELSWDVGPGGDGSFLDFYRYMIDVASMDFGGLTDHQGGGHYAYHWWLSEKTADMYYLPPRFVPLYGYERSVKFPNGHRNVFHSYRGVPIFAFQLKLDQTGVFPGVASGDVLDNDTKLLYEYLHKTGGVAISHTTGTDTMGTDWRDNDPEIEPVVEIYQGARNSYEALGAPRVHDIANEPAGSAPGGFQAAGMVWNALAKGYRLGTTSSSDHGSTHISYSLIYAPENDRRAILDALRRRHTYGATDNMILEVRAGDHFMGDELTTATYPELELKVQATGKIGRIDLVRNNQYIYTSSPLKESVSLKYTDREPKVGLNYYYFRVLQDDGQVAWASPVWIHYKP
jgi:hypothetical protein